MPPSSAEAAWGLLVPHTRLRHPRIGTPRASCRIHAHTPLACPIPFRGCSRKSTWRRWRAGCSAPARCGAGRPSPAAGRSARDADRRAGAPPAAIARAAPWPPPQRPHRSVRNRPGGSSPQKNHPPAPASTAYPPISQDFPAFRDRRQARSEPPRAATARNPPTSGRSRAAGRN